jgi:hypothetical protein
VLLVISGSAKKGPAEWPRYVVHGRRNPVLMLSADMVEKPPYHTEYIQPSFLPCITRFLGVPTTVQAFRPANALVGIGLHVSDPGLRSHRKPGGFWKLLLMGAEGGQNYASSCHDVSVIIAAMTALHVILPSRSATLERPQRQRQQSP